MDLLLDKHVLFMSKLGVHVLCIRSLSFALFIAANLSPFWRNALRSFVAYFIPTFFACPIAGKLYTAGGISSILKELSDDIVPAEGEEIYNPFTPVVSPTEEDTPARIDKIFLQTSSGYRQHSFVGAQCSAASSGGAGGLSRVGRGGSSNVEHHHHHHHMGLRPSASFGDTRCLLEGGGVGGSCRRYVFKNCACKES